MKNNEVIRQATPADYPAIEQLVKEAFKTAQVSTGDEEKLVDCLRKQPTFEPALEFVAEIDGKLVGHVLLTESRVPTKNGGTSALILAPLCVAFNYRNQGIGTRLLDTAMEQAAHLDHQTVFFVGNPAYYQNYSVKQIATDDLADGCRVPKQFVLARELADGIFEQINSEISF